MKIQDAGQADQERSVPCDYSAIMAACSLIGSVCDHRRNALPMVRVSVYGFCFPLDLELYKLHPCSTRVHAL